MRLRDRLSLLSPPGGTASGVGELVTQPQLQPQRVLLDPLTPPIGLDDDDRAARIARLRALIGQVAARERRPPHQPAAHPAAQYVTDPAAEPLVFTPTPRGLPLGELRDGPLGPLRIVERWLPPEHCHGRVRVRDALGVCAAHVAAFARDRALAELPLSRLLILDTETTGLAGGAGTVPFLIGLAYFDGDADSAVLKVEQLFLENLGQEAPLLSHLAERIATASVLVTYNGKSFDWPLLRARFVLSRLPVPELPPHLDLLHCARRIWSSRLPSVRLTEVERSVLGLYREDDVDGSQIPGLYHGYLRGGDTSALLPVLTHNEHDLVALAALLARLGRLYGAGDASDARDLLACAHVALRARDHERAASFAERAADESDDAPSRVQALLLRARLHARAKQPAQAIARYHAALEHARGTAHETAAHLALSRLYERVRELRLAYTHARAGQAAESVEAHGRRLGRLSRRLLDAAH